MKKVLFFAFAMAVALASCNKEPADLSAGDGPDPELFFTVNNKPASVGWQEGSKAQYPVRANVEWDAEITSGEGAELVIDRDGEDNPTGISVIFEENSAEEPREVRIMISADADVATKSYGVTVTQNGKAIVIIPEYVRVDATPDDWTGEYLLVYEGQAAGAGAYGAKTVLVFDGTTGAGGAPLDAAGNLYVLSPTTPGTVDDLAALTGAIVERSATDVTVTGGKIVANDTFDRCRLIIEAVDGGYSIKTRNGYYLGGGGAAGALNASLTFSAPAHVHTISVGDATSTVAGNAGVTFHNSAVIVSSSAGNNSVRINANTGRFGYWSGSLQHHVALYKRDQAVKQ